MTVQLKPLDLRKLKKDMRTIMNEIDRMEGKLDDHYSPATWQRLQKTTDKVTVAVEAVRMMMNGKAPKKLAAAAGLHIRKPLPIWHGTRCYPPDGFHHVKSLSVLLVRFVMHLLASLVGSGTCRVAHLTLHKARRNAFHEQQKLKKAS